MNNNDAARAARGAWWRLTAVWPDTDRRRCAGRGRWRVVACGLVTTLLAAAFLAGGVSGTQDAVANGDTRTLNLYQEHTKEALQITYKRNGTYDADALKQLNWFLRDWRRDEQTRMDPRLFDVVWDVYRQVGAQEPAHVVSAYRAPETNAMLRRRSRVVAEHSQHILGKAMDFYLPDVSMSRVRELGMRMQDGGVGFYPNAMNPFVHLDVGSVRAWPRMGRDQLVRLFPDGRTVHIPRDGKPFEGYEVAKAEILSRGGSVAGYTNYAEGEDTGGGRKSLWAMLFGGGGEDEDTEYYRQAAPGRAASRPPATAVAFASTPGSSDDAGTRGGFNFAPQGQPAVGRVRRGAQRVEVASAEPSVAAGPAVDAAAAQTFAPAPQVPSADEGPFVPPVAGAAGSVPQPPRRPDDLALLLAAVPLPPQRPVQMASLAGAVAVQGQMQSPAVAAPRATLPLDDRSALRELFEAALTPVASGRLADIRTARARAAPLAALDAVAEPSANVRMEFSAGSGLLAAEPDPGAFSGPAVRPLPILR